MSRVFLCVLVSKRRDKKKGMCFVHGLCRGKVPKGEAKYAQHNARQEEGGKEGGFLYLDSVTETRHGDARGDDVNAFLFRM